MGRLPKWRIQPSIVREWNAKFVATLGIWSRGHIAAIQTSYTGGRLVPKSPLNSREVVSGIGARAYGGVVLHVQHSVQCKIIPSSCSQRWRLFPYYNKLVRCLFVICPLTVEFSSHAPPSAFFRDRSFL